MKKKTKIIMLSVIPVLLSAGAIVGYLIYKKNYNKKFLKIEENSTFNKGSSSINVFPKIEKSQFYKYLQIQKGRAIISDDMIAKVINFVLKNSFVTEGKIKFWYQRISDSEVNFSFLWEGNNSQSLKTFKIMTSKRNS